MKIRSVAAAGTAWKAGHESRPDALPNIGFYGRFSKVLQAFGLRPATFKRRTTPPAGGLAGRDLAGIPPSLDVTRGVTH